jgi:hypothetical protein
MCLNDVNQSIMSNTINDKKQTLCVPSIWRINTLIAIAFLLTSCYQKGYYINHNGDDSNPGTKAKPFRTISKVNSLQLKPGDVVLFKADQDFEGTLSLTAEGTVTDSIKISTYGDGTATIDGGTKEAIAIQGKYFSIDNLHTRGAGRKTGNTTNGVSLINASHALIRNLKTEGFQKSGLQLYNCQNITIKKVYAVRNGFSGINVTADDKSKSRNILIQDCLAENNPGDPTGLGNHSGNGILVGISDSVVIDHCAATNNGWDMPRLGNGPVGIWAYETNNITIQYCISYRNKTAKGAKDGGGFDFDGGVTNSIIQYCLSYENEGAGYGMFQYKGASRWHSNVMRYCISYNDAISTEGSGGIFMWNGSMDSTQLADCYIHNNLIYSTHAPAVMFEPSSPLTSFKFSNNIFIGKNEIIHGPASDATFYGNVWWTAGGTITFLGHPSLDAWANTNGEEIFDGTLIGRQIDPMVNIPGQVSVSDPRKLVSMADFKLQDNSPFIDMGLDFETRFERAPPTTDFYGTPIPQGKGPEPGVYEKPEAR